MTVYTVHEPRRLTGDPSLDAERYEFVRDGFYFWAFVLGPIWMFWHRLWLVLIGHLLLVAALTAGLIALRASGFAQFVVFLALALLVGFEAGTLRRWTLRKRRLVDVVSGNSLEDAERRFFSVWNVRDRLPAYPAGPAVATAASAPSDVIGLFPEPQPRS